MKSRRMDDRGTMPTRRQVALGDVADTAKSPGVGLTRFVRAFLRDLRTPLYKNSMFLMINSVSNNVLGFTFWMIAAWFYSVSDFGLAAALVSGASLIAGLSTLGLGTGLIRFLPESSDKEKPLISSTFFVCGVIAFALAIVFVIGTQFWFPALEFLTEDVFVLLAFVIFAVIFAVTPIIDDVFIAKRSAKYVLYKSLVFHPVRLILVSIFAVGFGAFGIFASWGLALLLAFIVSLSLFLTRLVPGYVPLPQLYVEGVRKMIRFSFKVHLAGILTMLPGMLLPLLTLGLTSAEETAYFYVAWTIAGVLFVIPRSIGTSLFAEGSTYKSRLRTDTFKSAKLIFILLAIGIVLVFIFGGYALALFGVEFSEGGFGLLRILALSGIFVAINSLYVATKMVEKNITPIILLAALTAFGTIGIGHLLIQSMGIVGIGVGSITSQGLASLAIGLSYLVRNRRKTGVD